MHKALVFVELTLRSTCGVQHSGFVNDPSFCYTVTLADKYNLTLVNRDSHVDWSREVKSFGIALTILAYSTHPEDYIYRIQFEFYNFITVTNPASFANRMTTFTSPFDRETWTCLLVSAVTMVAYLGWVEWSGAKKDSLVGLANILQDKGITVTSILLGQVGGSLRKVDLVTLIFLLFGAFFLMMNLYQARFIHA